ncbi:MAG: hypothetical protein IJA36_11725 [Lachnospiraceae bacterium]|nr:hypothetical protein [Lachnospiraceae bacterium]
MKRFTDEEYGKYSVHMVMQTGIDVKCPNCNKRGIVTRQKGIYQFVCTSCNKSMKTEHLHYEYDVQNQCKNCGRYYRVNIKEEAEKNYPALWVECSYCGHRMPGKVQKKKKGYCGYYEQVQKGYESIFGLELWFLASFDGKPVWALNREHLAYLIEYVSAELREDPILGRRTQADELPTFMKLGKNRDKLVKLLKQMQEK